jgi:hypothetical protein
VKISSFFLFIYEASYKIKWCTTFILLFNHAFRLVEKCNINVVERPCLAQPPERPTSLESKAVTSWRANWHYIQCDHATTNLRRFYGLPKNFASFHRVLSIVYITHSQRSNISYCSRLTGHPAQNCWTTYFFFIDSLKIDIIWFFDLLVSLANIMSTGIRLALLSLLHIASHRSFCQKCTPTTLENIFFLRKMCIFLIMYVMVL